MTGSPLRSTPLRRAARAPRLLTALVLCASLAACTDEEPIRIGFVSGLTGRHYDLGISSRAGVVLAIEELNAAGGIAGRRVELELRDDGQDPDTARRAVEELIGRGVVAIVGHATSSMVEATLPLVDRERVLMVSPTASSSDFLGRDDWLVMLHTSTERAAHALADHVAGEPKIRRIAVVHDLSNRAFSLSWLQHFRASIEGRGAAKVRGVPFTSGAVPSYGALVRDALAEPIDAVLVIASALDTAAIAQQLHKVAPRVRLLGADWGFTQDVLEQGGAAVEGAIFTHKVDYADESPRYLRFKRAYLARFNRPVDFAAILSYEATGVITDALRRGARSREEVRAAVLSGGELQGLQNTFRIDAFGDASARPYFIMSVVDGRMTRVSAR